MSHIEKIANSNQCSSCGEKWTGNYSQNCGEHQLNQKHCSVQYLLSNLLENFTSLENRLIKTIWSFFRHPGELSRNYSIGKRVEYMKPITFFLLVNLLYVLFTHLSDFSVSFYDQLNSQAYSPLIKVWVLEFIENNGLSYDKFKESYGQVTAVLSRSLIILNAPLLAMFFSVIYRQKGTLFVDHLVFSIYYYAWVMVWVIFAQQPTNILLTLSEITNTRFISKLIYFDLLLIGFITFLALSSKTAYQLTWGSTLLRLPFAFAALVVSHFLYRFVQFVISFLVVILEAENLIS